jgi:hypothetical protein
MEVQFTAMVRPAVLIQLNKLMGFRNDKVFKENPFF